MRASCPSDGGRRSTPRGQTTIDFAIGMGVFLVVVVFALGFLPSIFAPFTGGSGAIPAAADRSADRLATDLLVDSVSEPTVLNETCTVEFFAADGSFPAGCRFTVDGNDLSRALGVADRREVNVTIRDDSGVRTLGGVTLAVGETPTTRADVIIATRVVLLGNADNRLVVRVW